MVTLPELVGYIDDLLDVAAFSDFAPNGLQVEGRPEVTTLVSGVTANQALVDAAIEAGADAVLVHHGYFWKGEDPRVVGMKRRRLQRLLAADVSLLAYHLPLDAHPRFGNNAELGRLLGFEHEAGFGGRGGPDIGMVGRLEPGLEGDALASRLETALGRAPLFVSGHERPVNRVAWCSGGAQGFIEEAVALGADAYITGEVSEQTVHIARECGIHFYAAGHHATERYGAPALGEHLAGRFGLAHRFIDIDNPA